VINGRHRQIFSSVLVRLIRMQGRPLRIIACPLAPARPGPTGRQIGGIGAGAIASSFIY